MEKVIISDSLDWKLFDMIEVLFYKEYFSYKENARAYVDKIYDFIQTIPSRPRSRTKRTRYGQYYCRYKANTQTTYYITFDVVEDYYFIKNIISNHTKEYPAYIKGM